MGRPYLRVTGLDIITGARYKFCVGPHFRQVSNHALATDGNKVTHVIGSH